MQEPRKASRSALEALRARGGRMTRRQWWAATCLLKKEVREATEKMLRVTKNHVFLNEKPWRRSEMRLSRMIPARRMTLIALWCKKDFVVMGDEYRHVRRVLRDPMDSCFWCGHEFEDGEMMALACFDGKGNKILCQGCATELEASQ